MKAYRPTFAKGFSAHEPGNGLIYGPAFADNISAWRWNDAKKAVRVPGSYSVVEIDVSLETIQGINAGFRSVDFCGIAHGFPEPPQFSVWPTETTTQALARLGFDRRDHTHCGPFCTDRAIFRVSDGSMVPGSCTWPPSTANEWIRQGCPMEVANVA